MNTSFSPWHRGGSGSPLVCLHGLSDTWRSWELVLPALERRHDVLAVTLAGHAGGPPLAGVVTDEVLADAVLRVMDEAGFETAHIVGNSLGGYVSLQLAARGRARSVVAFSPAGGWAEDDDSYRETLDHFRTMRALVQAAAPHADEIVSTPEGRRRATAYTTTNYEHIPAELLAHQIRSGACPRATASLTWLAMPTAKAGRSTRSRSAARSASSGALRTNCCPGLARLPAIGTSGLPTPTGWS
jgi:pimeloyl-ACP methyl ester carboxylesterase